MQMEAEEEASPRTKAHHGQNGHTNTKATDWNVTEGVDLTSAGANLGPGSNRTDKGRKGMKEHDAKVGTWTPNTTLAIENGQ